MKASEPTNGYFVVSHWVLEDSQFHRLSLSAKLLYFVLCKLRNRYTKGTKRYFTRTEKQLINDTKLSKMSIVKAKKELQDNGFIVCSIPKYGRRTKWEIVEQEHLNQLFKV